MNTKLIAVAAVAVALAAGASARASELVVNGGFDANTPSPNVAPLGWTLTAAASGSFFKVSPDPAFSPDSAPNSANFGASGDTDDILSQMIATTAGQSYAFSFDLAHGGNVENDFSANFDGVSLLTKVDNASFNYTHFSYLVTATGDSTLVSFAGRDVLAFYELDNVSVSSITVPEPAAWALMICGFGLTGGALRRRRAVAALV